ncbi:MAG: septum formation initiator family protein [Tannerella sp.]|jgi:cell division protein FtsB|nr:septum formation initiator family protein [Tannerella sp.]
MSRLTDFYKKYLAGLNKYWLVTILFFLFTLLVGDSSLYNRYAYDEKIRSLENEIQRYKREIEQNRKKLQELQTDKIGLEQFAREEYFMKEEDEDVFIIEE